MKSLQHIYSVTDESDVIPIIPYEDGDELIHSVEHPNCPDPNCPCNTGEASEDEEELS